MAEQPHVEVPARMEELLGWTVHKPRWAPAVRWHPVYDVPRAPRKLPEQQAPEPQAPPPVPKGPALPAEFPSQPFVPPPREYPQFDFPMPMNGMPMPPCGFGS